MQGFDRLEPQGFYDALLVHGLPRSINIDCDYSAQFHVPYLIRMPLTSLTLYSLQVSLNREGLSPKN